MELIRFFIGGPKILLVAAFILLAVLVLAVVSILTPRENTPTQIPSNTTPTPLPNKLTEKEEVLPTAKPQTFFNETASQTGTLIIESNVSEMKVLIDAGEGEAPVTSNPNPLQISPFRIEDIPVGEHNLFAGKGGYTFQERTFEIREGEITRLNISLIPLN